MPGAAQDDIFLLGNCYRLESGPHTVPSIATTVHKYEHPHQDTPPLTISGWV